MWNRDDERMTYSNGSDWVSYGDFGPDTYGLHCKVKGNEAVLCIRAEGIAKALEKVDELLGMLADGFDSLEPDTRRSGDLMTVSNVAKVLGVSPQRVYQMIDEGKVDGKKYGNTWMVSADSVEKK